MRNVHKITQRIKVQPLGTLYERFKAQRKRKQYCWGHIPPPLRRIRVKHFGNFLENLIFYVNSSVVWVTLKLSAKSCIGFESYRFKLVFSFWIIFLNIHWLIHNFKFIHDDKQPLNVFKIWNSLIKNYNSNYTFIKIIVINWAFEVKWQTN